MRKTQHALLTEMLVENNSMCHGALLVNSRQARKVPGSLPRRSPPQATGGTSVPPRSARRGSQRLNATGSPNYDNHSSDNILKILQWNCEGISRKKEALKVFLHKENIQVACLQETHLTPKMRFSVRGYQCVSRKDRPNRHKGGILILVSNNIPAKEITIDTNEESEISGVTLHLPNKTLTIFNCYAPSDKDLKLHTINIPQNNCIIVGDFNSHSPSWGYSELDNRGEEVEEWQVLNNLQLLVNPSDEPTFYSRRWKTTSTPDLAFTSSDMSGATNRSVLPPLATSDHKPIAIMLASEVNQKGNTLPRWNYKKADWANFETLTNQFTSAINCKTHKIEKSAKEFTRAILKAAKQSIPRGARQNDIPNWSEEL